jgi:hypothetical protein
MKLVRLVPNFRGIRSLLAAAALVLASAGADAGVSAPPAYPDSQHIPNGCHLSTLAFLNRFVAAFPGEKGEPVVIAMSNEAGVHWKHTVAVLSWHGQAWVRDEYFGTFVLGCDYDQKPAGARLGSMAEAALHRQARLAGPDAIKALTPPPESLTNSERINDVTIAASKVPFPATVFWVRTGKHEVPVAFFRPSATQIAVYEPLHGTCLAECSVRDDARIVALVAAKLGLRPDSVRADLPAATALVASR